jgi:hypothetical protein
MPRIRGQKGTESLFMLGYVLEFVTWEFGINVMTSIT